MGGVGAVETVGTGLRLIGGTAMFPTVEAVCAGTEGKGSALGCGAPPLAEVLCRCAADGPDNNKPVGTLLVVFFNPCKGAAGEADILTEPVIPVLTPTVPPTLVCKLFCCMGVWWSVWCCNGARSCCEGWCDNGCCC